MNKQPQTDRIIIFDTTLRDGEQCPGATLNVDEKLVIARQLARLGVDVIEAGFAFASPGDFEAVEKIAKAVGTEDGPVICSLARAIKGDIQAAAEAIKPAAKGRIHTFISTSDIHLEYQLKKSKAEVLAIAEEMGVALQNTASSVNIKERLDFSCALFDADGTSFVVHAAADDMVTDPSGNSGARIACAIMAAPVQ